ncbi:cytoplasmic protein [Klebsiella oxytoca]|uniref:cytoplasmic protein n=1 Tax=Klebsiella oxytoca TaxID=571 RepID=UPI003879B727
METLFTINACKTYGCRNLGLSSAADYRFPDYRLGYPALYCAACGSYPPLFNDDEFRPWLAAYLTDNARRSGYFCPACYRRDIIRYGYNPKGTQRLQCRRCEKVWTPKHHHSPVMESPQHICSVPLIVPFQGHEAGQKLYLLLSFDAVRGNVLHLSSNFTPFPVGASLRYRWRGREAPQGIAGDIVQRISQTEAGFLQRSQFDEIQYGSAAPKRHSRGAILRPVIAAHGHFKLLSHRFPAIKTHIIAHECFLRGAAIVAWAPLFRQRKGELWYVEEEINTPASSAPWRLQGKTHHGWWQNPWQLWTQGENRKMVCQLAGTPDENASTPDLAASRRFTTWLEKRPEFTQSALFSAGRVTQILVSLAQEYNETLTAAAPDD